VRLQEMQGSVLVIDDEADVRDQLDIFLRQQGFDVRLAINGEDALTKLEIAVPDVIILDIMMPVMDGFTFLDAIRSRPALATIPVLATSAGSLFPPTRPNLVPLRKPLELDVLSEAVRRAIEARRKPTGT
jgi:CheY-like chemotaxis protein